MQARGFDGALPADDGGGATRRQWAASLAVPALALTIACLAWGSAS
jgi:hypothetical protein